MLRKPRAVNHQIEPLEPRQLLAAGDPDPSFAGGAGLVIDHQHNGFFRANVMALQPDGKIVVAGEHGNGSADNDVLTMMRINPDGSPDSTFGSAGQARLPLQGVDINGVALAPDGKIVVVGMYFYNISGPGDPWDWLIARFNTNGSLDTSFAGKGYILWDSGAHLGEELYGVVVQPDQRIVVTGYADHGFAIARFLENGSLDPSFSGDGFDNSAGGSLGSDILIDPDGKLVVSTLGDFGVARYLPSGSLDTSFGNGSGWQQTNFPSYESRARHLARDAAGNYVIAGDITKSAIDPHYLVAARYSPSGNLDTTFGNNPALPGTTIINAFDGVSGGLTIQNDGSIVLSGTKHISTPYEDHPLLVRLTSAGVPDSSFGSGGVRFYDPPGTYVVNAGSDVTLAPDGNILFCGTADFYPDYSEMFVYKLVDDDGPLPHPAGWLDGSILRLSGMQLPDIASLHADATSITATLNGFNFAFPLQSVASVDINLLGGDDRIDFGKGSLGGVVQLGGGNDSANVPYYSSPSSPLRILGGDGQDAVAVDSGFANLIDFDGGADFDILTYNGTSGEDSFVVNDAKVSGPGDADYSAIERLYLNAGLGQDVITITSTAASVNYQLFGDAGDDLFKVTPSYPGAMSGFAVLGGANGNDDIEFDDGTNPLDQTYTINSNGFQYSSSGTILPLTETLRLTGGSGRSTFNVTPVSAMAIYIDGNEPATNPGDSINVNISAAAGRDFSVPAPSSGRYTFTNRGPVEFQNIERDLTPFGPLIKAVQFNYQTGQSVDILFSEETPDLDSSDFVFKNATTNQTLPPSAFTFIRSGAPGMPTTGHWKANSLLADGVYSVTLVGNAVHDSTGNATIIPPPSFFTVLSGDLNRDSTVSITDFIILASNFGKTGATFSDGDLNYDGSVTISDFIDLASRFGQTLSAAPALQQAADSQAIIAATDTAPLFENPRRSRKSFHRRKPAHTHLNPPPIPMLRRT